MDGIATARHIAAQICTDVRLKVAVTRSEREAAFRLIYNSYVKAGLCAPNSNHVRITPHQLLRTTDMFVAQIRDETICTLSLVRDSVLGLPMEQIFGELVAERRTAGLRLAEVSCLADRRLETARFFDLFCDLIRLMVQLAEQDEIDQLLVTVHPRHVGLYQRTMGYRRIGEVRDYSTVEGNPAVPLCLDLKTIQVDAPAIWNKFFGERLPLEVLKSQPIRDNDRKYFQALLDGDRLPKKSASLKLDQDSKEREYQEVAALQKELLCV